MLRKWNEKHNALNDGFSEIFKLENFLLFQQEIQNINSWAKDYSEVLLRLKNPKGEATSPFPVFRQVLNSKLTTHLDYFILENYFETLRRLKDKQRYSVNIYPETLLHKDFKWFLNKVLIREPELLRRTIFEIVEITWEEIINLDEIAWKIDKLKEDMELKFFIDDFPSGINNHEMMNTIHQIDWVKIDWDHLHAIMEEAGYDLRIAKNKLEEVVSFIQNLFPNCKIIIEKISNPQLLQLVKSINWITHFQGFVEREPYPLEGWTILI